ncbi:transcription-repair coupling factor [Sulfuriflexus sp.]|uniref:transcription-repair coupling factor n=1 Tax=Sulfuriflexus sp. TaxID=2015443 RepID=UPI0028CCB576|nr:transcription-repair coupling factor [Sulfuriflexus sp.]MDT8403695.1 transcription-repair coupling factor [Sulfuriflexus sp.]
MKTFEYTSLLKLSPPRNAPEKQHWGRLYGSSAGLALALAAQRHAGPVIAIAMDTPAATRLEQAVKVFLDEAQAIPVMHFPDWETLPYDVFSPHQDIISQRLETLNRLPNLDRGIVILPVATLMHRLPPRGYVEQHSLIFDVGDKIDIAALRSRLEQSGYLCVPQVLDHGDFAVRGSLIDLFPMGSKAPYRIDLFDDEIESIRHFDTETQRSLDKVEAIHLLPAREYPLDEEGIKRFRQGFRQRFDINPNSVPLYRDISQGIAAAGIEYYLPLFFDEMASLFDYLPEQSLLCCVDDVSAAATQFRDEAEGRYESACYDVERPIIDPEQLFLSAETLLEDIAHFPSAGLHHLEIEPAGQQINFATSASVSLTLNARASDPAAALRSFIEKFHGRILFAAESAGRREMILETLGHYAIRPRQVDNWQAFLDSDVPLAITVAPLEQGLLLESPQIAVICESQLFGEQVRQTRRRRKAKQDSDAVIRNLTELNEGSPVVHEEHGVGRYLGLQTLDMGGIEQEFLTLEYAGQDKLYVPVSSLHLISRYMGSAPDQAPLHKLGTEVWSKAKRRASERARDVAAELLDIYARRAARKGHTYPAPDEQYTAFAASFPFEETVDQENAILDVIHDMTREQPMDRLVCGDVGFGKTEVAMRAAFLATQGNKQVAVLVPTTLLAQQHYENFRDRFADWPVRIEVLSRFRSGKQLDQSVAALADGQVDIIIGTHKLLQSDIKFKNLGLVIIDEEHRFGVRQKDKFKALRAEVDVLTLTATPIPRTLNMALSQIRDLSVIATPPTNRLSIKTFIREWDDGLLREACLREIKRGGQIYFLHNEVKSIDKLQQRLAELVPEASVRVAHGQMRERELEQVMLDFYHQRFNVLLCTTIIETGIDIPSANTIIINRADKFGLAQLYQLRGRVGRSHHRAYAYLIRPERRAMTADAMKRLEALESMEELGTGFMLATHDLEIRGAGELLGDEQSGQIHEIGFSMYTELLERAVEALRSGKQPELDRPLHAGTEISLRLAALIPDEYLPDVHLRLIMYKRIANASDKEELRELQVEMIDRFGLLPQPVKNLFRVTELKLLATPLGIKKIDAGPNGARIIFEDEPNIDPMKLITLIQTRSKIYRFDGKQTLRMNRENGDEERADMIEALMDTLAEKDAA